MAANISACAMLAITLPLLALPWFLGGTVFEARLMLMVGCLIALIFWIVLQVSEFIKAPPLAWVWVAILVFVSLPFLQCQRLPNGIVSRLSPTAAKLWEQVLMHDNEFQAWTLDIGLPAVPQNPSLSIYPAATRFELAQWTVALSVFFVGTCFFHEAKWLVVASSAIALNAASLAFVGLAQQMRSSGSIYEREARELGAQYFSAFTNRNNAAGYLNLCIAVAIGILLWALIRGRSADDLHISPLNPKSPERWDRFLALFKTWMTRLGLRIASIDGWRLFAVCTLAITVTGLVSSLSRGGVASCVIASLVTFVVFQRSRDGKLRLPWITVIVIGVFALGLIWGLGRDSAINSRLAPFISGTGIAQDARWSHWIDALRTAKNFWRTGSGLGTYRQAYTLYERKPSELWWHHADNQYLEILVECGLPGLLMTVLIIGLLVCALSRLLREPSNSVAFVSGVAGTYALTSQVVHSLFDFGIMIPANSALFGLVFGSIVGQAIRLGKRRREGTSWLRLRDFVSPSLLNGRSVSVASAVGLVVAVSWATTEIYGSIAVRQAVRAVDAALLTPNGNLHQLEQNIARLSGALELRSDDAEGQLSLAELWLFRYRQQAAARLAEQEPEKTPANLWQFTAPGHLHGYVHQLWKESRFAEWDALRGSAEVQSNVLAAARSLDFAVRNCAALGRPLLILSQIAPLLSRNAPEKEWLSVLRPRSNADPQMLLECGLLEIQRGEIETGFEDWRVVLGQSPSSFVSVLRFSQGSPEFSERVRFLLPHDPEVLLRAAREEFSHSDDTVIREMLIQRVKALMGDGLVPTESRSYVLAVLASLAQDWKTAIVHYLSALDQHPHRIPWRYELALVLQNDGLFGRAREQASICVQSAPGNQEYQNLLRELIRLEVRQPQK